MTLRSRATLAALAVALAGAAAAAPPPPVCPDTHYPCGTYSCCPL